MGISLESLQQEVRHIQSEVRDLKTLTQQVADSNIKIAESQVQIGHVIKQSSGQDERIRKLEAQVTHNSSTLKTYAVVIGGIAAVGGSFLTNLFS